MGESSPQELVSPTDLALFCPVKKREFLVPPGKEHLMKQRFWMVQTAGILGTVFTSDASAAALANDGRKVQVVPTTWDGR